MGVFHSIHAGSSIDTFGEDLGCNFTPFIIIYILAICWHNPISIFVFDFRRL